MKKIRTYKVLPIQRCLTGFFKREYAMGFIVSITTVASPDHFYYCLSHLPIFVALKVFKSDP